MRNLEFRLGFLITLCWTSGIAERSDNGYFYDIPQGAPFEIPLSISSSKPIQSTQSGQEFTFGKQTIEILPAVMIFQDTKLSKEPFEHDFQQQLYRNSEGLQPMVFDLLDGSEKRGQQICGPEPIVAQLNPDLMRLANERPVTRVIKTCDSNNNCKSIILQSDPNRRQVALAQPQDDQVQRKASSRNLYLQLKRPPNRRLFEYTEIERKNPYYQGL